MTKDEQILSDLTKHLRDKVLRNISDHVELCRDSGVRYEDVATELMLFFSQLTASYAAHQYNIGVDDFTHIMALQFKYALTKLEDEWATR